MDLGKGGSTRPLTTIPTTSSAPRGSRKDFFSAVAPAAPGRGSSASLLVQAEKVLSGFPHKSQPLGAAASESFLQRSCATLRTVPMPTLACWQSPARKIPGHVARQLCRHPQAFAAARFLRLGPAPQPCPTAPARESALARTPQCSRRCRTPGARWASRCPRPRGARQTERHRHAKGFWNTRNTLSFARSCPSICAQSWRWGFTLGCGSGKFFGSVGRTSTYSMHRSV